MAANNGTTEKIINFINTHGSITPGQIRRYTTREPSKVIGDVNESLRNWGETAYVAREGNRYGFYEDVKAA